MSRIFARSPYIIEVNESGQSGSKVELFIWNSGTQPANPQYTLSKDIPTSTNLQTTYNISPYILEYFNMNSWSGIYNTADLNTPTDSYANVVVKRYKDVSGTFTLLDTIDYTAFNGYTLFTEGSNKDLGRILLDEGTYYYKKPTGSQSLDENKAGSITFDCSLNDEIRYTNLLDLGTTTYTITSAGVKDFPRVLQANLNDGNKIEYYSNGTTLVATFNFLPQCELKYTPVIIDYVNRYGAWARTFFYKTSKRAFKTSYSDFSSLHSNLVNYDVTEAKNSSFNFKGEEEITTNSGWVKESYAEEIKQIMLSDRILADGVPVKCDTKSLDIQTGLDNKTISYSLKFKVASDYINNIV
jgi:hypothetical protein